MTTDVFLLILYVLVALGISFLCSVLEAVLLSITPGYVAALEKSGSAAGARIKALKAEVDRPLSAILSLNTIAHTVGAAGAGAQAAHVFGDAWLGVFSGVLTVLILLVSEIIPKSLGSAYWKRLAPAVARILGPLTWLMTVTLLVPASRWVTKFIGGSGHPSIPSREEISAIAVQGAREGIFPASESRVLQNLFKIADLKAGDVMTPRTVLFGIPEQTKVRELLAREDWLRFSRIPVHEGDLDKITGYVIKSDVLLRAAKDELDLSLVELKRPIPAVPKAAPLSSLFDQLLERQSHVALVVDEYGGTAGLVTLEDLVETLLGLEIVDEADAVTDMQEHARRQWRKRALRMGLIPEEAAAASAPPPAATQPAEAPPAATQPAATQPAAPRADGAAEA
ncbi:MAG: hemolysin family protein [Planctomycetota bacterium]